MIKLGRKKNAGFTLIEVLVVAAIIAFITGLFIRNFNANRLYLQEAANIVLADIRNVQQRALGLVEYPAGSGDVRCGYGFERVNNISYRFYAGPESEQPNNFCGDFGNKNFNSTTGPNHQRDDSIEIRNLPYGNLEFKSSFSDIFFEPPDPKIWVNNQSALDASPSVITIGPIGQSCSGSNCRTICVYTSGSIYIKTGNSCP